MAQKTDKIVTQDSEAIIGSQKSALLWMTLKKHLTLN